MKMQNVPLNQIVWNPWRDKELFPIDDDHVADLRASIKDHGFFASLKGRRRNGKIELGCGHARFEAAKKSRLDTIPIFIDDIDDDAMLRLMTDENALQSGNSAGAALNEVAAVTRRLIEGLLSGGTIVPPAVKTAFEDKGAMDRAVGKLRNGTDPHLALGHNVIRAYLGEGDPDRAHRGERQIREAISALKQSARYDEIVDEAVRKYPPPTDAKPSKSTAIAKTKQATPRRRLLDERTANVFTNDHQFHAFREAVTTRAAQQALPVEQQLTLAKSIMKPPGKEGRAWSGPTHKGQIGANYIKKMVQYKVEEGLKAQRDINKQERELYLQEQRDARIDSEIQSANSSLRSLISALARLNDLADEFPAHPKLGGFSARLDTLAGVIQQFSKKLK